MHVTHLDNRSSPFAVSYHSAPRSGEALSLRLARLAADLGNGMIQQTPSRRWSGWPGDPRL